LHLRKIGEKDNLQRASTACISHLIVNNDFKTAKSWLFFSG